MSIKPHDACFNGVQKWEHWYTDSDLHGQLMKEAGLSDNSVVKENLTTEVPDAQKDEKIEQSSSATVTTEVPDAQKDEKIEQSSSATVTTEVPDAQKDEKIEQSSSATGKENLSVGTDENGSVRKGTEQNGSVRFALFDNRQKSTSVISALQKIAGGSEEETIHGLRNDLEQYGGTNDITFPWGDKKKGIYHIAYRRGLDTLLHVIDAVTDGKITKFVSEKKTIHIEKDGFEAVLSLDEHGEKKSWLLTGWEIGVPDAIGEVSTHSDATQPKPTFSRQELGAGLENIISQETSDVKPDSENNLRFSVAPPVKSKAFKEWFGNSKAVDAEGKPLVVYHGTEHHFTVFSRTADWGYHFGTKTAAEKRLKNINAGEYGRIIPAYLRLENPLYLPDLQDWSPVEVARTLVRKKYLTQQEVEENYLDSSLWDIRQYLIQKGYDGVVYKNRHEDRGSVSYTVFSPEQIKSADAVTYDDNGEVIPLSERFKKDNPDIRFKIKRTPQSVEDYRAMPAHPRPEKAKFHSVKELYDIYKGEYLGQTIRTISGHDLTFNPGHFFRLIAGTPKEGTKGWIAKAKNAEDAIRMIEAGKIDFPDIAGYQAMRAENIRLFKDVIENGDFWKQDNEKVIFGKKYDKLKGADGFLGVTLDLGKNELGILSFAPRQFKGSILSGDIHWNTEMENPPVSSTPDGVLGHDIAEERLPEITDTISPTSENASADGKNFYLKRKANPIVGDAEFANTRGEAVAAERTGGEPRELFCRRQKSEQKTFCEAECLRAISPRAKRQSRKRRTLLLKIRFACHKSFIGKQGVQGEACVPLQTGGLLSAEMSCGLSSSVRPILPCLTHIQPPPSAKERQLRLPQPDVVPIAPAEGVIEWDF